MAKLSSDSDDKYKGAGKFGSTVANSLGGLGLGAVGAFALGFIPGKIGDIAGKVSLVVGPIAGGVFGWRKASKAQAQHDSLVAERNGLQQRVETLEASQNAAQATLNTGWAGKVNAAPGGSFADRATASVDTGPRNIG